jgi:aromatase
MAGHTDNEIVIDAPFDRVWRITNDIAGWPQLFSEYAEAVILEQRGETVKIRLSLHPDKNGKTWSWVSERTPDAAARTVRAHRVETGVFKYMSLFWEYEDLGDRVRMRWVQDFEMKPGAPLDDAQMTDRLNTNSAGQMKLIKDRIEAATG